MFLVSLTYVVGAIIVIRRRGPLAAQYTGNIKPFALWTTHDIDAHDSLTAAGGAEHLGS